MIEITNALPWIAPSSALGLVAIYGLRRWLVQYAQRKAGAKGEHAVKRELQRIFSETAHNFYLPLPGGRGLTEIDHVALTPNGILVIETKSYSGEIIARPDDSTWTQIKGRSRRSFQNPLRQNQAHIKAVQALGLDVPVIGHVVFAGQARFHNGIPEGVSSLSNLSDDLNELTRGRISDELHSAWEKLLSHVRTDREAKKEHLRGLKERFGGREFSFSAAPILMGATTLVTAWIFFAPRPSVESPNSGAISQPSQPAPNMAADSCLESDCNDSPEKSVATTIKKTDSQTVETSTEPAQFEELLEFFESPNAENRPGSEQKNESPSVESWVDSLELEAVQSEAPSTAVPAAPVVIKPADSPPQKRTQPTIPQRHTEEKSSWHPGMPTGNGSVRVW